MSWEGYYRHLCSNGHITIRDGYEEQFGGDLKICPKCKDKIVWWQQIDQTNGCDEDAFGEFGEHLDSCSCGDFKLETREPVVYCVCNDCGTVHQKKETTYKIPTNGRGHLIKGE